jgi:hypothetical protein
MNLTLADSSSMRISNQDSVGVWDSTMIFVVQRKISSLYHWKKMYMWQLRHILNDSLKLTNLMIPRLAGTPTTNITLKTFATNTLYRADFNYNFRKIDSLAIAFDLNDFTITGDTVRLKTHKVFDASDFVVADDTVKIKTSADYFWTGTHTFDSQSSFQGGISLGLANSSNAGMKFYNVSNSNYTFLFPTIPTASRTIYLPDESGTLVTSDSSSTHSWVKSYVDTVTAASKPSSAYGGLYNDYASSHLYLGINGSTYRTLKGMTVYNNHNLTLTDSSITIQKAGSYLLTISATAEDTLTTGGASIFAGLFRNGTRIPVASTLLTTTVNSHRINFCITSNLILQANDVLLLKFQGTTPADQLVVWNINYSVYKL